jgi:hypothetical protein
MPHWLIKSALQRAISLLPASHFWNELFQRYVTRSLDLTPERLDMRLDYCRIHLENFIELRPTRAHDFTACELGTGWFPVVPAGLFLCGAKKIWTFDIAPLLSRQRLIQMFGMFQEYERSGKLHKLLPRLLPDRLERFNEIARGVESSEPDKLLEQLEIHFEVRDAQNTGLQPGSIDLFASTGVLEYIPKEILKNILTEFRRVGSSDAVQSHYLNLIDQYSYFDRSITPFNFLKFSEERWKLFNSPITWLNRMRISDYRELFGSLGFEITKEVNTFGSKEDLKKIRLAPEFQKYSEADLLVLTSWLTAKPTGT